MESVSFSMFLIDRGVCDAYTLGQWHKLFDLCNYSDYTLLMREIGVSEVDLLASSSSAMDRNLYLSKLYPDNWQVWRTYCKLIGKDPYE